MEEKKLNIGGTQSQEGWEVFNIEPASYVDHVGNAKDLSRFEDKSFSVLYASHILEHFDYNDEIILVLKEWRRVLLPGGKLYVSVPDMDQLASLFLLKDPLNFEDRFQLMRILFGGHMDPNDYHLVGFNQEILTAFLSDAGFLDIQRVDALIGLQDTSTLLFKGIPVSLNVVAST